MMSQKIKTPYILTMSLVFLGCEMMGPKLHEKLPIKEADQYIEAKQPEVIYQELSNEALQLVDDSRVKTELYPGSGEFVSQKGGKGSSKAKGKGEYSLNFDAADLGEVTKVILSDILGKNYVLSPKVSGTVTLQTSQPLSKDELIPTLEMLLQINNAALVYQDGLYQIKPKADAISSSALTAYSKYRGKVPLGYQTRVVPVRNVAVEELVEIIKPLMQEKTILHVDKDRNMMLISGTAIELARAMDLVSTFDIDIMRGRSFGLFPLINVQAATIIEELEQVFNKDASSGKGFHQFLEIERLNAILAITHQAKFLKQIERWVLRLDRANTAAGGGVNVYRVQHVDAVELATTLSDIFSQSGKQERPASVAAGRKAIEVSNKAKNGNNNKADSKATIYPNRKAATTISDVGEVKIIADEVNNALIIVASAQDYPVVQRVIDELDVMPLQVLIDATIVAVSLTDDLQYGIQWFFEHNNGQNAGASEGVDLASTAANLAIGAATGGFGYAFVSSSGDIRAVLNAAATDNKINVISSPSLMVLNNHEATIQVGDEVPIRSSESTNTGGGDTNVITSQIQMRETGVTLRVKPRVNANGFVIMEIEQSVDNAIPSTTSGIDSPTIQQRKIQSSVAVHSGETIVLGGLISENDTFTKTGIPTLHQIPFIGPLFGSTGKNKEKTELVILITPRVVKSRYEANLITNEFKRKLSGIYEEEIVIIQE